MTGEPGPGEQRHGRYLFRDPSFTRVALPLLYLLIYVLFGFPWFSGEVYIFENFTLAELYRNEKNFILQMTRVNRRGKGAGWGDAGESKQEKQPQREDQGKTKGFLRRALYLCSLHEHLHTCYLLILLLFLYFIEKTKASNT